MAPASDTTVEDAVTMALELRSGARPRPADPMLRRQLTLAAVSRRAVEAEDEKTLLADAARLVAESLDLPACAAAWRSAAGEKLSFWYSNFADAGQEGKEVPVPAAANASLASFTMNAGRPVVCANLATENRFSDAVLRRIGVQSAMACPLEIGAEVCGVLAVLCPQPHHFQAEDVLLLDAISGMAASSIGRRRAEVELNHQQRVRTTILETLDALVIELSAEGRILTFNRACQKVTGFAPGEVKDRHVWSAFLVPEEVVLVQSAFDRLKNGLSPVEFQSYLLTKHGMRRRIAWSFSTLCDADGRIETMVGTGVDITDRCALEDMLERSQEATEEARRSLSNLMDKIEAGDLVFRAQEAQPFSEIPEGPHGERRKKPRRSYPYIQLVAPMYSDDLPSRESFQPMRCKDIAAGGFSFISPTKPDYPNCIVAFGVAPSLTYLKARVVHSQATEIDGQRVFAVGCQYTGRIEY